MSRYTLDTDILSLLQRGHPRVLASVNAHPSQDVAVTVISVEEQLSGWYSFLRQAKQDIQVAQAYWKLAESVRSLCKLPIVDYDLPCVQRYNALRNLNLNVRKPCTALLGGETRRVRPVCSPAQPR